MGMARTRKKLYALARRFIVYGVLVLAALYSTWPIFIMALTGYDISLTPLFLLWRRTVTFPPGFTNGATPIHYLNALSSSAFQTRVENTVVIAGISIAMALAAGVTAAFALARIPIRGKGAISYVLLALRAIFPVAAAAPLYVIFTHDGLWDTYVGVALGEELAILSIVVWVLRGFFSDIPREIYEAAAAFGASEGQIFRRVALRMVVPGMVVTALFAFILIWNEFAIADTLSGPVTKTVAVGVWTPLGGNTQSFTVVRWDALNAAGFLSWIPAIGLTLGIKRYLARCYSLGTAGSRA
jgi:multiple sugar transport system permease protein